MLQNFGAGTNCTRNRIPHEVSGSSYMDIGVTEILFVLGLALVLFGPKKLPQAAREWGRTIYRLKGNLKRILHP